MENGVLKAWADGKEILVNGESQIDCLNLNYGYSPEMYAIKPEPKLRPWRPEEVPVGALIRDRKNDDCFRTIISAVTINEEIKHANDTEAAWTPTEELEEWLHSTDGGKTWQPCGVQE